MTDTRLALLIDRLMRRIHASLHEKAPSFDTERVGPGGAMVLFTLADLGPAQMHELAERLARDKSQMTRAVRALEQKGIVTRTQSADDGRACVVSLTDKGEETVDRLSQALADTIDDVLSPISPAQKQELEDLLRKAVP